MLGTFSCACVHITHTHTHTYTRTHPHTYYLRVEVVEAVDDLSGEVAHHRLAKGAELAQHLRYGAARYVLEEDVDVALCLLL